MYNVLFPMLSCKHDNSSNFQLSLTNLDLR